MGLPDLTRGASSSIFYTMTNAQHNIGTLVLHTIPKCSTELLLKQDVETFRDFSLESGVNVFGQCKLWPEENEWLP
jgi:hypothetical protein